MSTAKKLWQFLDGKKLWAAIIGAVTLYGLPYCRAKWPFLPWDEILIPLLGALGVIGIGHKVIKSQSPGTIDILNKPQDKVP